MKPSAWVALLASSLSLADPAQAERAAPSHGAVAGMRAEAGRLAVGVEEAELALGSAAPLRARPDIAAGLARIVRQGAVLTGAPPPAGLSHSTVCSGVRASTESRSQC